MNGPRTGIPVLLALVTMLSVPACASTEAEPTPAPAAAEDTTVDLPQPQIEGEVSLEETLQTRRSVREYADAPLALDEVSQLLWAAQGITSDRGGRTAPSAGALYPLEVYLVAGDVEDLEPGVFRYDPAAHRLLKVKGGDVRTELCEVSLGQEAVRNGAIDIVISAVYERTEVKYGDRAARYVHMEAGHAAQNIYLQAAALELGTVTIGAFSDDAVARVLDLPENEAPLYVIPVGRLP